VLLIAIFLRSDVEKKNKEVNGDGGRQRSFRPACSINEENSRKLPAKYQDSSNNE